MGNNHYMVRVGKGIGEKIEKKIGEGVGEKVWRGMDGSRGECREKR